MQVSVTYDVRNPEASDPLPLTGLLAAAPANTPEQIHLAYSGDTGMYVSWSSGEASNFSRAWLGCLAEELKGSFSEAATASYQPYAHAASLEGEALGVPACMHSRDRW